LRKDLLLLFAESTESSLTLAGPHSLLKLLPVWIADVVPKAEHRTHVRPSGASKKGGCDDSILISIALALNQSKADHCGGDDSKCPKWNIGLLRDLFEARGTCREGFEQADGARGEQMLGRHEPHGDPHDGLWCDVIHRVSTSLNAARKQRLLADGTCVGDRGRS
jgi:hypothetical protein